MSFSSSPLPGLTPTNAGEPSSGSNVNPDQEPSETVLYSTEKFIECGEAKEEARSSHPNYDEKTCPHAHQLYGMIEAMLQDEVNPTEFMSPLFKAQAQAPDQDQDQDKEMHWRTPWLWDHFGKAFIRDFDIDDWREACAHGCKPRLNLRRRNGDDSSGDEESEEEACITEGEDVDAEPSLHDDSEGEESDQDEPEQNTTGSYLMSFGGHFSIEWTEDDSGAYNNDFGGDEGQATLMIQPSAEDLEHAPSSFLELISQAYEYYVEYNEPNPPIEELSRPLQEALNGPTPQTSVQALLQGPQRDALLTLAVNYWQLQIFNMNNELDWDLEGADDEQGGGDLLLLDHDQAVEYVDGLEMIELSTIAENDRKCPFCWLNFGEDEDENTILANDDGTLTDINPVRTACGHTFHRHCLMEVVEKSSSICPICKAELY